MVTLCRFCPFGQETSVVESSWPLLNAHIPVPAGKSGFLWNRGEGKICIALMFYIIALIDRFVGSTAFISPFAKLYRQKPTYLACPVVHIARWHFAAPKQYGKQDPAKSGRKKGLSRTWDDCTSIFGALGRFWMLSGTQRIRCMPNCLRFRGPIRIKWGCL